MALKGATFLFRDGSCALTHRCGLGVLTHNASSTSDEAARQACFTKHSRGSSSSICPAGRPGHEFHARLYTRVLLTCFYPSLVMLHFGLCCGTMNDHQDVRRYDDGHLSYQRGQAPLQITKPFGHQKAYQRLMLYARMNIESRYTVRKAVYV